MGVVSIRYAYTFCGGGGFAYLAVSLFLLIAV